MRNLGRRDRMDAQIAEELAAHIELAVEEAMRRGVAEEDARRAARLRFGNPVAVREKTAGTDLALGLETLTRDVRFALRQMRKTPGFTAVVVLTLMLGIGATTAIFTLVYSTLLRSLPYPQANRILAIHDTRMQGRSTGGLMTGPRFFDIQARSRSFQSLAFFYFDESTLVAGKELPVSVKAAGASAGFWDVFGTAPMLGRTFNAADDAPNASQTVVLSYPAWQKFFGGDRGVIGRQVTLMQQGATIIGVMPENFSSPGGIDLWHPAHFVAGNWGSYRGEGVRFINVFGRLRPGVTLEQAQSDLNRIGEQLRREYPQSDGPWQFSSETLREARYGSLRPALVALLLASALLLLIACINVANLLLSRATARRREVALRRALGASGGRLAQQFLIESALLALSGGSAGIAAAFALTRSLASSLPGQLGRAGAVQMDWAVTGVALLFSLGTGMIFGLAPMLEAGKLQLQSALKQGEARLGGSWGHTLRSALISVQVGLSLVLLVGASLMGESLWKLMKQPLGFAPEHVLTFSLVLPWNSKPEQTRNFYDDVQRRIENLPGVLAAGQINAPPTMDWHVRMSFDADWLPRTVGQPAINAENRSIAGNVLAAMGTPLLAGRTFTAEDQTAKAPPVLVSQALVREFLPKGNAVGHHLLMNGQPSEIVGVVADVRGTSGSIAAEPGPVVYWPANAGGDTHRYFLVRTKIPPEQLVDAIRQQVFQADPRQSIGNVATMDQLLGDSTAQPRLNVSVAASFAGIALLLACVGIYGVVAWFAAQRMQEIGVRMALGATRSQIAQLFVRRAMLPAAVGLLAGLFLSLAASRLLRSQLYGVQPHDPRLYAASVLALLLPVLLATLRPALRAAKTDPMKALRTE
ncbi:MAG TPA: ABC transporter permease [Acidobacteriaceae bacterium]|nr:ABC transporter permease [Acidobacteriaceae bacterium]